ncbi:hypothetical protein [Microbulbifer sp. ZKSA004]|uniref:hypothetical protein n=1 Tax=unclassified Microbulbifer TaxID=2619833 RepID=UPI0040399905
MKLRIFIIWFISSTAFASEHLEPEDSQFSRELFGGYTHLVLSYLGSAYEEDVIVRLIGFPSFSPEYVLGIKQNDKENYIFFESPKMQLWGYQMMPLMEEGSVKVMNDEGEFVKDEAGLKELESQYPKSPQEIPRIRCKKEIRQELADKIQYVWQEMLYETRYPRDFSMGADGQTYHFSAKMFGNLNYAGKVWSPSPESKTGKLVRISDLMVDYCLEGKRRIRKELEKKVSTFKVELENINKSIQPSANASVD